MKKSIYYLIANTLTIIVAAIVLACIEETKGFPEINLSLNIVRIVDKFTPIIFLLPVEAASIILCAYECTSDKKIPAALDIAGLVVTILAVFFACVSVVWVGQNYQGAGAAVKIPFILIGCFVAGLVSIFLTDEVSKKNPTFGSFLPLIGSVVIIAGFVLDLLIKY